jgi:hypothetical protein
MENAVWLLNSVRGVGISISYPGRNAEMGTSAVISV